MTKPSITHEARCLIYDQALSKWGLENQLLVAIEEMSEVQKAITKLIRVNNIHHSNEEYLACFDNLIEEIADATIMLEQLRYFYGMNAEVEEMMDRKIMRLEERINNV